MAVKLPPDSAGNCGVYTYNEDELAAYLNRFSPAIIVCPSRVLEALTYFGVRDLLDAKVQWMVNDRLRETGPDREDTIMISDGERGVVELWAPYIA